jgi:RNA polymerase sigma-70 factor (ECF subfamily)
MKLADLNYNDKCWSGIDLHWAYITLLPSLTRKTHCKQQAKDILHDGFIRFALSSNPNRHNQPHAYLQTIVHNLILEKYRKDTYVLDYQESNEQQAATSPSAEHIADVKQRLILLSQIIQDLPPRCREVFILYRIDGQSQQSIATHLNISVNMVERHLIRALLDLRAARIQLLA